MVVIKSGQESEERYLSIKELQSRYDVSASTIYEWLKGDEGFPAPRKFGRTTRWSLQALLEWEKARTQGVDRGDTDSRIKKVNKVAGQVCQQNQIEGLKPSIAETFSPIRSCIELVRQVSITPLNGKVGVFTRPSKPKLRYKDLIVKPEANAINGLNK